MRRATASSALVLEVVRLLGVQREDAIRQGFRPGEISTVICFSPSTLAAAGAMPPVGCPEAAILFSHHDQRIEECGGGFDGCPPAASHGWEKIALERRGPARPRRAAMPAAVACRPKARDRHPAARRRRRAPARPPPRCRRDPWRRNFRRRETTRRGRWRQSRAGAALACGLRLGLLRSPSCRWSACCASPSPDHARRQPLTPATPGRQRMSGACVESRYRWAGDRHEAHQDDVLRADH